MKRAFTLVEVITVLAIIVILAALAQPALTQAKYHAQVNASVSRLKQLHLAVELYRGENDLTGFSVEDFPPYGYIYSTYLGFGKDFFRSPCGYKDGIEANLNGLSYQYVPFPGSGGAEYFGRHQENSLLFRDPHCNTKLQWDSPYMSKRKLGVLVSGQIVNENAVGSTISLDWWLPVSLQKN